MADQAEDNSVAIGAALKSFHKSRFTDIQSGKFVVSTSGAGKSVSFYIPPSTSQMQPEQVTILAQEFREVFNDALVTLTDAGTTYDSSDPAYNAAILAAMMDDDRLWGVREFTSDFGGLRCA